MTRPDRLNRARGCLLGLAVGDAIGTSVEFKARDSFPPITDMIGGGPFSLKPGQWTDDTSMALCLATSLLDKGFDLQDQITRYVRWYRQGYLSSTGHCFDIGMATRDALQRFESSGNPKAGSTHPRSAGNGCLMRLAPIPIRYLDTPDQAVHLSAEQSQTTHGADECIDACKLFGSILVRALQADATKAQVLLPKPGDPQYTRSKRLQAIEAGNYVNLTREQIRGNGYVVDSLEAALWCFTTTDNFRDAILTAVNLGDDADTTAAITGQIAGAFYGESAIPRAWLERLVMAQEIGVMAERLSLAGAAESSVFCRTTVG